MKQLTCILITLGLTLSSNAQIESTKWLLGNNNVISFDDEISVVDNPQNVTPQVEGAAMVTNCAGEVIFTATGDAIYDSEWSIIDNGDYIDGSQIGSAHQSPIVLQRPGFPSQYYVFYTNDHITDNTIGDLKYSIVNICDENNEISILEDEKNIQIDGEFSENLQLAEIDKDNYWLLTTELHKVILKAYKIDVNGINLTPIISEIDTTLYSDGFAGTLKVNNGKNKLTWSCPTTNYNRLSIYDFDINTGEISNQQVIADNYLGGSNHIYGVEWSPSDAYIYYTNFYGSRVQSYKMEDGTIDTLFSTHYSNPIGDLKLSPKKDKIIVVQRFNNKLGQITDIENGGIYSEIDLDFLGPIDIYYGLQEQVINYGFEIPSDIISAWDLIINEGEDFTEVSLPGEYTNVIWSDGQIGNSAAFTEEGVFQVTAYYNCHAVCEEFIIERQEILIPDFNATVVDISVVGDVSTNDVTPTSTTYGPTPVLKKYPEAADYTLTINSDGTYTFISDRTGVYIWDVPVCIPPLTYGCNNAELVITVIDFLEPDSRPIANLDVVYTELDTDIEIHTLDNDRCAVVGGCLLDPASVTLITNPSNGTITTDGITGNFTYLPNIGFTGQDTLRYQVCVDGEPDNCAQADQIIIILAASGLNRTLAADDFNTGGQDIPIIGDVSINDTDPSNDNQTVVAQSKSNEAGTLTLLTDGTYIFVPNETFYGSVDFSYTICDDNASQACANATLHILIVRDLYIQVRLYLEGALNNNGNEIGTTHSRPLMRDDLRESPFTGERYIPDTEPYDLLTVATHWETADNSSLYEPFMRCNYDYTLVETKFKTVLEPTAIFSDNGENSVVDWVSVELRDKNDHNIIVASRSGLVQRDGDVMDLNGKLGLRLKGVIVDDYFIVVRHRNHLGAMTSVAKTPQEYTDITDFTIDDTDFFDFGTTKNIIDYTGSALKNLVGNPASQKTGYKALWGGDFDGNGRVKYANPNDDLNNLIGNIFGYETNGSFNFSTNFDLAYGYQSGDFDMDSKSKFDSPNDDKNYLYGKLLFYPLNTEFNSNFDFFIEQVPEAYTPK